KMPLENMGRRRKRRPVRLVVGGGPLPAKPAAPTITIPVDGAVMNDNTPTVSGTGEPGLTVMVRTATQSVGTATVQEDGTWTLTASQLADGVHTLRARQANSHRTSDPSTPVTITVDTVAPAAPVILVPTDGAVTNNTTPTVSGTAEAGAEVTLVIDSEDFGSTTADGSGEWTVNVSTPLDDGTHELQARAADEAGNTGPLSDAVELTIDTVAPEAPVILVPQDDDAFFPGPIDVQGELSELGGIVHVYNAADDSVLGQAVPVDFGGPVFDLDTVALAEDTYTIYAVHTDDAGNVSDPSNLVTFTVADEIPDEPGVPPEFVNVVSVANPSGSVWSEEVSLQGGCLHFL